MSARTTRRAFTLIELCAAGAMLAVAMSLTLSTLAAVTRQQRAAEVRQRALEMAENILEQAAHLPFSQLTPERLVQLQQASRADEALPEGKVELALADQPGTPPGKRIDLKLSWRPGAAKDRRSVRLSAWAYRIGDAHD